MVLSKLLRPRLTLASRIVVPCELSIQSHLRLTILIQHRKVSVITNRTLILEVRSLRVVRNHPYLQTTRVDIGRNTIHPELLCGVIGILGIVLIKLHTQVIHVFRIFSQVRTLLCYRNATQTYQDVRHRRREGYIVPSTRINRCPSIPLVKLLHLEHIVQSRDDRTTSGILKLRFSLRRIYVRQLHRIAHTQRIAKLLPLRCIIAISGVTLRLCASRLHAGVNLTSSLFQLSEDKVETILLTAEIGCLTLEGIQRIGTKVVHELSHQASTPDTSERLHILIESDVMIATQ